MSDQKSYRRPVEEPAIKPDGRDATVASHPAYAQISASRVSGSATLYGSDFTHGGYVSIRIAASTMRRNLSHDMPMASIQPMIEVSLSEAQWAHFVSSMNIGMGTQCTLTCRDGQPVPGIPEPVSRKSQFAGESSARMKLAMDSLAALRKAIEQAGLSKVKAAELLSKVYTAQRNIGDNQQFVADMFSEHMEKTIEAAKIEVNGYVNGAMRHAGLQALAAQQSGVAPLRLDFPGVTE